MKNSFLKNTLLSKNSKFLKSIRPNTSVFSFSNLNKNSKLSFNKFLNPVNSTNFIKINNRQFSSEEQKTIDITSEETQPELNSTNTEKMVFKAETKKLLEIVTHSLYTDKEIFLRELLSNCSDALEKQRYLETSGKLTMTGDPLYITINTNEKAKTITLFDSGVGMSREEMAENLGTIAKSGTQGFLKQMKDNNSNESLIGQFGVGFYSSFIVGDQVEVISKTQTNEKASKWVSDGSGEFEISDIENPDFSRGTRIVIHLKPECRDFSRGSEIIKIAKKHSNFISYSIKVNGEKINDVQAIWYRNKKEITNEEYQRFYEVVNNGSKLPYKYLLHFTSDVPLDIKSIVYIPSQNSEKFGMPEEHQGLSLYSRKVLIKPKCAELLPKFLRFVKGVIDCSDIPLSISRESYQDSNLIFKLKLVITKRILKKLEEEMKNNPEEYDAWFGDFKSYLKEGILSDPESQTALLRLQRYKSNFTSSNLSIEDYVEKMLKNQNKIYYFVSTEKSDLNENIHIEQFAGSDLPILCSQDPIDEMIFRQVNEYKDYKFVNIENESDDFLDKLRSDKGETINKLPEDDISPYTLWLKNELEPNVGKVTLSKRLGTNNPLIVTSDQSANMKGFMAMMNQNMDPAFLLKNLTLEINPSHDLIINLNELRKTDMKSASLILKLSFDAGLSQANLGILNKEFSNRSFDIAQQFINLKMGNTTESVEEELKVERLENTDNNDDVKDKFESLKVK
jgi:TNF receptor-associated protein 1